MTKTEPKPPKPQIDFPTVDQVFPTSIIVSMRTVESVGLPSREMPDAP